VCVYARVCVSVCVCARADDEEAVVDGLPWGLQREVRTELFKDVLVKCSFFYGMGSSVYGDMSVDMALSLIIYDSFQMIYGSFRMISGTSDDMALSLITYGTFRMMYGSFQMI